MSASRLEVIEEIFHSARQLESAERANFLSTACGDDRELRREVESLLQSDEKLDSFIAKPLSALAAEFVDGEQPSSAVGRTISHYEVLERIGSGGMGDVYVARDVRSGRKAALKLLPLQFAGDAERFRRFQQETRAVIALNHPHILTTYEVGEENGTHFIVGELIEGKTLREHLRSGPLGLERAVEIAMQVASALVAAHKAGIVHRDMKPENIMLRDDGYVKVLDFGIAKFSEEVTTSLRPADAARLGQTTFGATLGTLHYMSPEQARGDHVDHRTDFWSLGVVLYEMLSRTLPFTGSSPEEILAAIRDRQPAPLREQPARVQRILSAALAKDRAQRSATAGEMLEALKECHREIEARSRSWPQRRLLIPAALLLFGAILAAGVWSAGMRRAPQPAIPEKSIAVLPFQNLSGDPENAYFAEGIHAEILTRLSRASDLKVTSRPSTQRYQSTPRNVPEIARQLGVAHILEGTVQKSGEAIRVNVQLIRAASDSQVWGETFDRKLTDIFSIESDVATAVADQLHARLTASQEQMLAGRPTENIEAYDAYLRGLAYSQKAVQTPANAAQAQKYFREAVQLDPNFALAWALLSIADSRGYINGGRPPALLKEAREAADKALALHPQLGEALLAKGLYHLAVKEHDTAQTLMAEASQVIPNDSRLWNMLGAVEGRRGNWEASDAHWRKAERLDPRNPSVLSNHATTLQKQRRFSEALRLHDDVLNITPDDPETLAFKAEIAQASGDLHRAGAILSSVPADRNRLAPVWAHIYQAVLERRPEKMIPTLQKILDESDPALPITGELRFWLGWLQELAGDHLAAQNTWKIAQAELEPILTQEGDNLFVAQSLALVHMGLRDKAAAFAYAERAQALVPIEKDAVDGPENLEILARVAAQMGERDRAFAALEKYLSMPSGGIVWYSVPLTRALLRVDPMFDPLRQDPRFAQLVAAD
jgi:non-specific serine/threonine protein kinase